MQVWQKTLSVAVVIFAIALPLAPQPAEAWVFGFFVRGLFGVGARSAAGGVARGMASGAARTGFRQLARGGGQQLLRNQARTATRAARTRAIPSGQARMQRVFGSRPYQVRSANAQVLRSATVEGDLLVFREAGRKVGFAQWEREGLVLYRADGRRMAKLLESDNRLLAYDNQGNYIGQFVEEIIEEQLTRYFVDSLGQRHATMDLSAVPAVSQSQQQRFYSYAEDGSVAGYSMLVDGMLQVFDAAGQQVAYGAWEAQQLVLYDVLGDKLGVFRQEGEKIIAYDTQGKRVGHIEQQHGKAVFLHTL